MCIYSRDPAGQSGDPDFYVMTHELTNQFSVLLTIGHSFYLCCKKAPLNKPRYKFVLYSQNICKNYHHISQDPP